MTCTAGLLILAAAARAQGPGPSEYARLRGLANPWSVRAWTSEDGLPMNGIDALAQTRDGYIWMGTEEGVVRFDGQQFTLFNRANTAAFGSNVFSALRAGRDGGLWLGSDGGLVRLKDGRFSAVAWRDGTAGGAVLSLLESRDGSIWVGTKGGGLGRLRPSEPGLIAPIPGFSKDAIYALAEDASGGIWAGTKNGLKSWRAGTMTVHPILEGRANDYVRSVLAARDGTIWVGLNGGGLARLRDGRVRVLGKADGLASESVLSLAEDDGGGLWIGTNGGGLDHLKDGRVTHVGRAQGLSSELLPSLLIDADGRLWAGTADGGVNLLLPARILNLGAAEGLSEDAALAVTQDRAGDIWIGTAGGGLNRLRGRSIETWTKRRGLPNDIILSLGPARDGSLWIGMAGGGLGRLRDGVLRTYTVRDGLPSDIVLAIAEDREGAIWLGTNGGGLARLVDDRFSVLTTADGLPADSISCLSASADGGLWIGTDGGGLARLSGGVITRYSTAEGLSSVHVLCLAEDGSGALWIGTAGGGIDRLKDGRLRSLTSRQGLFNDSVFCILFDGLGGVWMTSNRGLFRADQGDLEAVLDGARATLSCRSYGRRDGLRSVECNGGVQPAGWRMADGSLWFPTMGGVAAFAPAEMGSSAARPKALLEEVRIDHRAVPPGPPGSSDLELGSGPKNLEFQYTAFLYDSPQDVRFQYRLQGSDRDWVEAGPRRTAYYTSIGHGRYSFSVRAADRNGRWGPPSPPLRLTIRAAFTETPVFYGLILLAAGVLALVLIRARTQALMDRELKGLVAERTRELESEVRERRRAEAAIQSSLHEKELLIKEIHHRVKNNMQIISSLFRLQARRTRAPENLAVLNEAQTRIQAMSLVHERLYQSGDLSRIDLAEYIRGLAATLNQIYAIQPGRVGLILRLENTTLDINSAGPFGLLLSELVSNALKHAFPGHRPGTVTIDLRRKPDGRLELRVADDGVGFPAGLDFKATESFGLQIVKLLAEQLEADLELDRTRGTAFTVTFGELKYTARI